VAVDCSTRTACTFIETRPSRITSPAASSVGAEMRWPRTNVPFLLPRSSIVARSCSTRIRAWRLDTVGASIQTTPSSTRPSRFSPWRSATSRSSSTSR